jgi:uncharacterized protein (TIGR03083 family)
MLDTGAHLSALAADSQAFADLATDLDRPVPACPDWKVADLVAHLGAVYSLVRGALTAEGGRPSRSRDQAPAAHDELLPWFLEERRAVLEELTDREPDAPAWNFTGVAGTFHVGWWRRRQAMETAIHLVDLQQANGAVVPVAPELAADGVDEALTELLPRAVGRSPGLIEGASGTLHLHCTDTDGEWMIDFDGQVPVTRREHAKGDAAVRGPASELFLLVWNRRSLEGLEVFGQRETAEILNRIHV